MEDVPLVAEENVSVVGVDGLRGKVEVLGTVPLYFSFLSAKYNQVKQKIYMKNMHFCFCYFFY